MVLDHSHAPAALMLLCAFRRTLFVAIFAKCDGHLRWDCPTAARTIPRRPCPKADRSDRPAQLQTTDQCPLRLDVHATSLHRKNGWFQCELLPVPRQPASNIASFLLKRCQLLPSLSPP